MPRGHAGGGNSSIEVLSAWVTVDCVKLIAETNYDIKAGPESVLPQQLVPLRIDIKSLYNRTNEHEWVLRYFQRR